MSTTVPFILFSIKNALVNWFQQNHRLSSIDWHKVQDVVTSRGSHSEGVRWSLYLWTPELLLCSTIRAFEVSSPMWTLPFVFILKRAEPSGLHVIVVIFYLLPFPWIFPNSKRLICLQFDLFHYWTIWRWPLMFCQASSRIIHRFFLSNVCLSGVIYLFSKPNSTLVNLLMLTVPHMNGVFFKIIFVWVKGCLNFHHYQMVSMKILGPELKMFHFAVCLKDSPCSPTVIVSAGVDGNTQKI